MSTFEDDFLRLNLSIGPTLIPLVAVGLTWPPPQRLAFDPDDFIVVREATDDDAPDEVLHRQNFSQLTDEQRAGMSHVARGAEYRYADEASGGFAPSGPQQ